RVRGAGRRGHQAKEGAKARHDRGSGQQEAVPEPVDRVARAVTSPAVTGRAAGAAGTLGAVPRRRLPRAPVGRRIVDHGHGFGSLARTFPRALTQILGSIPAKTLTAG